MTPRILHVLDTCGAGGIEVTFLNVLRTWHRSGRWAEHRVLAASGGVLEPALRAASHGLTVAADPDVVGRVFSEGLDLVHFLFERAALQWVPFVVGRTDAAVVYGKGYDASGSLRVSDGFRWQPDESLMWACDQVTFTTTALADTFVVPSPRATVLGKAADVRHFLRVPEPGPGAPDRIVCVANLHGLKRVGDLIAAMPLVRAEHRSATLRLVGADDRGEGRRLRALAARLGVADACEWVGRRHDVAADLAASRIFALPSAREGVPTAVLEAMAAARPVVVTDVGHVRSIVEDGVEGYLVPVGDVPALADRLARLLRARAVASQMGRQGRRRAAGHDVAVVAGRLRTALERALARPPARGAAV